MILRKWRLGLVLLAPGVMVGLAPGLAAILQQPQSQSAAGDTAQPAHAILQKSCFGCHGQDGQKAGGLDVGTRAAILASKKVVPGDAAKSVLIKVVSNNSMPAAGDKLTADQKAALKAWINAGAPDWAAAAPPADAAPATDTTPPVTVTPAAATTPAAPVKDVAQQVHTIFQASCYMCHGANGAKASGLDVSDRGSFITARKVVPGDPDKSRLVETLASDAMPAAGPKLSPEQKAVVTAWVKAGAPDWKAAATTTAAAGRKRITEASILNAIVRDLNEAPERSRPYLRYYSVANLSNNPQVDDEQVQLYRTSLAKLINSLSWNPDVVTPQKIDAEGNILRVDLRDLDWTPEIWSSIIAAYPYGYQPRGLSGQTREIQALSGAVLPYIRVDWFVAHASIPPLYHTILQLPDNVPALEEKLGVRSAEDVLEEKVLRAGRRDSGVSRNNRAVERHRSLYGAYWKSFDFATSAGPKNIFSNPVDIHPDGGEFIFHLPNGLIAYYIANGLGKRLDEAPVNIVHDFTNNDDPIVRTGRSCIGCHFQGTKHFQDEVRQVLDTQRHGDFDLDKALALYLGQQKLDETFDQDDVRFRSALAKTGSPLPGSADQEPVNRLSERYFLELSVEQAAADANVSVAELKRGIDRSSELERLGYRQLLEEGGGIKRDIWEENFGTFVQELRLGDYLAPTQTVAHLAAVIDSRHTISLGNLTGPDQQQADAARTALAFWFNGSDKVRVVPGDAECALRGSIIVKNRDQIAITVGDPKLGLVEEVTGSGDDIHFLTQQLANKVHFRLTSEWLPINTAGQTLANTPIAAAVPTDPGLRLQTATQGPVKIALTLDRGPGSTYRFGDPIHISFRVDRDCFLTIFDLDSTGAKTEAFPNQAVTANRVYNLDDVAQITAGGTPGMETLIAVATLAPQQDLGGKSIIVNPGAGSFAQGLRTATTGETSTAVVRFFTVDNALDHGKGLLEVGAK